ncbi:unannotated protein [freshwater metagenome]|uniref:Unannotated protein n=1 Tax=freshwater metagenome TaxID=449393 RepID=A0A6J7QNY7_9ZZZZ|nr:DUF4389 domain-containing protein [Actinomycetota bacterium]MSY82732.1 DUF4389 domain-containing protein [Actinomycetota bacterium]
MATQENQVQTIIHVQLTGRNKATAFWRWILIFPVFCLLTAFSSASIVHTGQYATGVLVLPVVLTLLFRGVYPSYVLTFNKALLEFNARVCAYALLLTDDYPSIEANPNIAVHLPEIEDGKKLSRGLPLVKWIFAIPLILVGVVYSILSLFATIYAWLYVSVTGTYPESVANLVLGTLEYWNRVTGYAVIMVTDEYPPFTLKF